MKTLAFTLSAALCGLSLAVVTPAAHGQVSPAEAQTIAEEGFIYGLPIVMNYAVMYEYAVGQAQEAGKPIEFGDAEPLHIDPAIRAADGGTQRNGDHVDQQMLLGPLDSRIGQIFKPCKNCHDASTCHEKALHERREAASVSTARLTRGDLLQH